MEALDTFLPANAGERKTLADLIFAKLDSGEVVSTATIQKVRQGASSYPQRPFAWAHLRIDRSGRS
jgi:hypothetical protein